MFIQELCESFMILGGFVKLKKIQNSEKNSEVGGWVKPQLGFFFWVEIFVCVFLCCFFRCMCFQKKLKKWIDGWVSGVWIIRVFLGFWDFFNLTRPLTGCTDHHNRLHIHMYCHVSELKIDYLPATFHGHGFHGCYTISTPS